MSHYLPYFTLLPLLGLVLSALLPAKRERAIFGVSIATAAAHLAGIVFFCVAWLLDGRAPLFHEGPTLYETHDSHFSIDFFFDGITATYAVVASALTCMVLVFSRFYMHRDQGFKRFFNNVLFFFAGLNIVLFSGNFETLFIGWEILGVTSFFLIAYYRDRYLPVKNALKVVSLYRVADVAMLLAIWLCHHTFERNVTFAELSATGAALVAGLGESAGYPFFISLIFLLAAAVKSAQLPFSAWLPRAMEGPTTSSAIFYGSLSVHIGVFLLLRTFPIWEKDDVFRGLVLGVGLLTSAMATFTARVQSTVKTQIAYASIAQIGLMFAEVALGLHHLAMVHFVANAFLRCYQLLVSPSVLSYLIHDQFFHFVQPQHRFSDSFWGKMRATVFVLSIKEWNVDTSLRRYLWQPLKQAGGVLGKIPARGFAFVVVPILLAGFYLVFDRETLPIGATAYLPTVMAVIGTVIGLKAFTDRGSAHSNWLLVVANQLFSALSMGLNAEFETEQIFLFLSGIVVSAVVGLWCIERLRRAGEPVLLDRFRGHAFYWPRLSLVFVLACLGMSGFPITPTFIGEDLLLGKIDETQLALLGFTALSLILDGLAVFRIYARLFLGPNEKGYHEVAFKSS